MHFIFLRLEVLGLFHKGKCKARARGSHSCHHGSGTNYCSPQTAKPFWKGPAAVSHYSLSALLF
jgi:hypothetical protein